MDLSHPSPATWQAARHDWIWRARRSGLDLTRRTLLGLCDRAMLALPTPGRDPAGRVGQDWLLLP